MATSFLYNKQDYDLLMSKPHVKMYIKKQTSVTASELHDLWDKWDEAGMKLPAPLAAFHLGKPSYCTFWNHAKGAGCKREKDGKKCDRDHKCMWCGSSTHGAYMRNSGDASKPLYQCPFYEAIRLEMAAPGIEATVGDLDDFVEDLRELGPPSANAPQAQHASSTSGASAAPISKAKAASSAVPSSSAPFSSNHHAESHAAAPHVPVGGIPVSKAPKASAAASSASAAHAGAKATAAKSTKDTKVAAKAAASAKQAAPTIAKSSAATSNAPSSNSSNSSLAPPSSSHAPGAVGQPLAGAKPKHSHPGPVNTASFMPYNVLDDDEEDQNNSFFAGSQQIAARTPLESLRNDSQFPASFVPSSAAVRPPIGSNAPYYAVSGPGPIGSAPGQSYQPLSPFSQPANAHPGAAYPARGGYYAPPQQPVQSAAPQQAAQQSPGMQLRMRQYAYGPSMELNIHSPLCQTENSLIYGASFSHTWMLPGGSQEVVVKLFRLSRDASICSQQQAQVESEFITYTSMNQALHPNIIATYAREDKIEIGPEQFALLVMERCHSSLSNFLVQHMTDSSPMTLAGLQTTMVPSTSLSPETLRVLCDQLVQAYLFLHRYQRYSQRHIYPSNLMVSKFTPGQDTGGPYGKDLSTASPATYSLKVHDFNFVGKLGVPSDPIAKCFKAPEAAQGQNLAGPAGDLWAIGCVLYYISTGGNMLFMTEAERDDISKRTTYMKRHGLLQKEPLMVDLINRLTSPKAEERPPLEVVRHHPALWSPEMVVTFVCQVSAEMERTDSALSGLVYDIVASPDFFQYAFPKASSWESYVLPPWLEAWKSWTALEGKAWDDRFFKSTRTLLRFLHTTAENFSGGHLGRAQLGTLITQRLHHFIIALWSHLQQIGQFDANKNFSFV